MSRTPQVTARELSAFLLRQGYVLDRQAGSHLHLRREPGPNMVTIPMHRGQDLGRGLALAILKQAGFTVHDHLRLR